VHQSHPRLPLLHDRLNDRSLNHPVKPSLKIRILFRLIITNNLQDTCLPSDEREISISALVADKILASLENTVQDSRNAFNLVDIAVDGTLDLLWMLTAREPPGE
jgi:hypothetical protein